MCKKNLENIYCKWATMDSWQPAEAACLLTQRDPDKIIRKISGYTIIDGKEIETRSMFKVVKTWCQIHTIFSASPFFYINKALLEKVEVPEELLNVVKDKFLRHVENLCEDNLEYPLITNLLKKEVLHRNLWVIFKRNGD